MYFVFWKLVVILILADGFSLYTEIFLVLTILPMDAIERVISERKR